MKIFAKSDIGKAREMNQDYFYVSTENGTFRLLILADGMGGYNGGEIASQIAVQATKDYIEEKFPIIEKDKESIKKLIESAMNYANIAIIKKAQEEPELEEMGTTLEICLQYQNKIYIGHIGDSRIYRIRKNIIRKLTTDHSYVEKLVKDGTITKEEAMHHPKKNMLMKALGCTETIEPDIFIKEVLEEDTLLLCSDGLTNMVTDHRIFEIIKDDTIKEKDKALIQEANDSGGYDNITVIVAQIEG